MKTTHNYSVVLNWDARNEIWVALVPELPGCIARGDTRQKALEELQTSIPGWMEAMEKACSRFAPSLPSIQTLQKANRLLNTAEIARLLGMAPRTLSARIKNGTPLKQEEAERLRDALAEHAVAFI